MGGSLFATGPKAALTAAMCSRVGLGLASSISGAPAGAPPLPPPLYGALGSPVGRRFPPQQARLSDSAPAPCGFWSPPPPPPPPGATSTFSPRFSPLLSRRFLPLPFSNASRPDEMPLKRQRRDTAAEKAPFGGGKPQQWVFNKHPGGGKRMGSFRCDVIGPCPLCPAHSSHPDAGAGRPARCRVLCAQPALRRPQSPARSPRHREHSTGKDDEC